MKVSIITICLNNEKDIRNTLESVVKQTNVNIEYIVIDGGSTDDTLHIIKAYEPYITTLISEKDKGLYDAINKGLRLATGDIVGLIHAGDQLFDASVIEKIVQKMQRENLDAVYGNSKLIDSNGKVKRINKSPNFAKKLFEFGWMPSHQSIYIKRTLLEQYGYYRTDLGYCSDYEFVLRYFYFNTIQVARLNEYIVRFALGGVSTKNYLTNIKKSSSYKRCWQVNGKKPPLFLIPFKFLNKVPQFLLAKIVK